MAIEGVLRRMLVDDVPAVMEVQEPASVAGLSGVFPQDVHPFPREVLAQRWREEIADPALECFVIERAGSVAGFAALDGDEVKHFGVAVEEWGAHWRRRPTTSSWPGWWQPVSSDPGSVAMRPTRGAGPSGRGTGGSTRASGPAVRCPRTPS